jgi:hypothetical protein
MVGELSRREAALRAAATTSLAGIALVQAIELPSLLAQGGQFAVLAAALLVSCLGLGWALASAPAGAAGFLWRAAGGTGALVVAGFAVPRAFWIPGSESIKAHWLTTAGTASAVLALVCIAVAIAAARPTRAAIRQLLAAAFVAAMLAPGVAVLLVAAGPTPPGGAEALTTGGHVHSHGGHANPAAVESAIVFAPLPGGGGHYVYRLPATPRPTPVALGLIFAAAFMFTYGAITNLRRRTVAPAGSTGMAATDLQGGLA